MIILLLYTICLFYLTKNRQVTPIFRRVPFFLLGANGAEIDEMEDVASSFASEGWGPAIAKTCEFFGVDVKRQYIHGEEKTPKAFLLDPKKTP